MQPEQSILPVLAQTIRQRVPFPNIHEEAFLLVQFVASRQMHQMERLYKRYGLTAAQYNVLRILRGAGAQGLPCGEVGHRMIHTDSDVTRLLDRMEKKNWIRRARSQQDRRVIAATITDPGLAILSDLDTTVTEEVETIWADLPPATLQQVVDALNLWVATQNQDRSANAPSASSAHPVSADPVSADSLSVAHPADADPANPDPANPDPPASPPSPSSHSFAAKASPSPNPSSSIGGHAASSHAPHKNDPSGDDNQ